MINYRKIKKNSAQFGRSFCPSVICALMEGWAGRRGCNQESRIAAGGADIKLHFEQFGVPVRNIDGV